MAGRKEYELLLKLKAALGGNFSSTFQTAMNTTKQLQNSLQRLKTVQGDISAYKKTADAISAGKIKVQDLTTEHDKFKGRLAESTARVKELEKALTKSAKATGVETEEYKRLESELKKAKEDKARLSDQTNRTAAAVDRASGKVAEQEQKLDELTKSLQAAGVNTNNLTKENEKLEKQYNDLKRSQENFAKANSELDKNKAAVSATRVELAKTVGVAAAAGAAFYGGAIKPAVEFESAIAGVNKTISGTPEQLLKIQNGIRKMATEIPLGTTEIAAIAEAAGQLGIKTDSILGFTRVMADLGVTTNLAGEEAASTLAKFANITGMSQGNFENLGSTIVALGNNLATTEADIAAMGLRLAGAGKQVGLSEAQILSYAGALSSVGIEAEAGGSAFSKVMVNMQLAVETGSKDLVAFAKVAGVSANDFKNAYQQDAAGAINLFIKGLSNTKDGGESAIKVLDDMGITEVRMRDALLRAAGASDVFAQSLDIGTKAWSDNKALATEAEQRYKTSASAMQVMKNAINDIGISLGTIFLPKLAETVQRVSEVAENISTFASENKETVETVVKVTGVLIGAKIAFLGVKTAVLSVVGVVKTVKVAMAAYQLTQAAIAAGTGTWAAVSAAATVPTAAFGAAMAAVTWPVLAVVAAIAAVIAIVVLCIKYWDKIKESALKVWTWIKDNWKQIALFIINPFAGVFSYLYKSFEGFRNFINGVVEKIKAPFIALGQWFNSNVIQPIISIFVPLIQKIGEIFSKIWEIITVLFGVLATWFQNNVITPVIEFFRPIVQMIGGIFQNAWGSITGAFASVITFFTGVFSAAWEAIKGVFAPVGEFFAGIWASIVELFTTVGTAVGDAISGAFKAVVNTVIGFAEGLINKLISGINGAIKLINEIPGVSIELLTPLNIPKLEKGSNYTPDTFIAGDVGGKGGELVTGARGRKVFTAAQTDSIFANINRMRAINNAASTTQRLQEIPTRGGSGAQSFTIQYNPTIYVDGNKPGDLEEKLKQNNESLLQMFKEFLRRERENERRMVYA